MNQTNDASSPKRIAIFSRYSIAEHYDLAAEFESMLKKLNAKKLPVLHINLKSPKPAASVPSNVLVKQLPFTVDRSSQKDILFKSMLLYALLPIAAYHIRKFKPDVIFVSEVLPLCGLFLKWACGTKAAIPCGDRHLYNRLGNQWWSRPFLKFSDFLEGFEISRMDGMFMRAKSLMRRLHKYGVDPACVRVVYDAPHPDDFFPHDEKELRSKCGFAPDDVVLLYHGVMHRGKGIDKLLQWTADLRREDARIGMILVGTGSEEANLRNLARQLDFGSRALFTGWLKTVREVGNYCNATDICIPMRTGDPANIEMIPGGLIHSMACGKIVVAPRLLGVAEIIRHGENGFMFTPDDGEDFKNVIRNVIHERHRWPEIGRRARLDVVESYSVEASATKYADMLEFFASL